MQIKGTTKMTGLIQIKSLAFAAVFTSLAFAANAAEHEVKMVNKDSEGRAMQFEPAFLKAAPGDTVKFTVVDKTHNSESYKGAIPEGAEAWKGKINEEVTVTLSAAGLYAYRCLPHQGMGMVGLIQVGENADNIEAVQALKMPPKAKQRMDELLAQVTGATN
jgi:pseudoazurin